MKKFLCIIMAVLMLAAVFAGCGNNGSDDASWENVKQKGVFVLGLDDAFPPMGYRDTETGEIVGFDIDLAREVCSRLGVELKLQPIDWDSKEFELNEGNIDCIWNGFTFTEKRNQAMNLSVPYMKNTQVIMVLKDSPAQSREDLAGKGVAVQQGSSGENAINGEGEDQIKFKESLKEVISTPNYMNALTELNNGIVEAVVLDKVVADDCIAKNPDTYRIIQKDGADDFLTEEEYVIAFRKNDDALMNKVIDTLKEMKKDGKLGEISTDWFGGDITTIQ